MGLTTADARAAYGAGARVASLPLIGYGPANLMNVPECFVYRHGNAVVATIQRYPVASGPKLVAIYQGLKAKQVRLGGLGSGALLFDVLARPQNYQEVVILFGDGYVLTARVPLVESASAPVAPPAKLVRLLHGVRSRLDG